mmetsp:Transcript_33940/g.89391  ORF Transcript_33940/g.89391 Transcript_33940/m.89391 type:complete len:304 (+) Transcript_33940:561-1472(+)
MTSPYDDWEFDAYLRDNAHLSANTVRAYKSGYTKIMEGLSRSLRNSAQVNVIKQIGRLSKSPNSINQLLNIAIQVRRYHRMPVELLLKRRERNQAKIDAHKDEVNAQKAAVLPSLEELKAWRDQLYIDGRERDYLINFLLLQYHTRNKDLDVAIVARKSQAKDPNTNYLLLRKNDIVYIRRNYKTAGTYGEKRYTFKNRKVREALRKFISEQQGGGEYHYPHYGVVWLLSTGENQRIGEHSIGKFIRGRTLHGLSEGDYNKVQVSRINDLGDFRLLQKMSKARGTSVDNLITEYHLNFKSSDP